MRWLVLGATGSLGTAVMAELARRGWTARGAARSGADIALDVSDTPSLDAVLDREAPDAVINCAALVAMPACEADPAAAYGVNARPVAALARWARVTGRPFVQVSTDQFFLENDGRARHDEDAPVTLISEYARTKFAAEAFALTAPSALVARTNMAAAAGGKGKASIAEWALANIEARAPMTLFDDYVCSTIDAPTLARALFDLVERGAAGRLNVASREVASKYEFVHALAAEAGVRLDWARRGSAASLDPPRAIHVGLDVTRAESVLGWRLPDLREVAANFAAQRRRP
ncbi:MAG: sugar nucleotide-binding protein [Caulobacterales bacterium]|nr:sugar nucleotide-binding protein [Caulobacterales bacterium]